MNRELTTLDRLLAGINDALGTVFCPAPKPSRNNPAGDIPETVEGNVSRRHVAGLMRVNHAGEVAAQGLYQGQAATARLEDVRAAMEQAAVEENDHLAWCEERLAELDSRPSVLDPIWYAGSFLIGAAAGIAGDQWSLGFVAETERQVVEHLDDHLQRLPEDDERSRSIIDQMRSDELRHASTATAAGGAELPQPVRKLMGLISKIMTKGAYRI
jgi:ubiquinone biosynthesis monooxygenase Coq7